MIISVYEKQIALTIAFMTDALKLTVQTYRGNPQSQLLTIESLRVEGGRNLKTYLKKGGEIGR